MNVGRGNPTGAYEQIDSVNHPFYAFNLYKQANILFGSDTTTFVYNPQLLLYITLSYLGTHGDTYAYFFYNILQGCSRVLES